MLKNLFVTPIPTHTAQGQRSSDDSGMEWELSLERRGVGWEKSALALFLLLSVLLYFLIGNELN